MNAPSRPNQFAVIAIALVSITGCTSRPHLIAAAVEHIGDHELVNVTLSADDARLIKRRELYFSIVIVDCAKTDKRLTIQPYVSSRPASRFDFPIERESATFRGAVPPAALMSFETPCVFLRGGGYLSGKLESDTIALVEQVGGAGRE